MTIVGEVSLHLSNKNVLVYTVRGCFERKGYIAWRNHSLLNKANRINMLSYALFHCCLTVSSYRHQQHSHPLLHDRRIGPSLYSLI